MKKLCESKDMMEIGILRELLEEKDIRCVVKNEYTSHFAGIIPFTDVYVELWVLHKEDYERAKSIFDNWVIIADQTNTPWICQKCKEQIEGQYESCWNCAGVKVTGSLNKTEIAIKKESLPTRCEICHKDDFFEPAENFCFRCN